MTKLRLIPAASIACLALVVALAAAAEPKPTKALLPKMVVPNASLARLGDQLRRKFAFFSSDRDAALSSPDPNDTAADLRRLGRIAGYVRGRNAVGAFGRRPPKGLLAVGTSAILWRDARSAAAAIRRDIADQKRLRGKAVEGGRLVRFAARKVPSLGRGAVLSHADFRPTGGTHRFSTEVTFRVGSLRGNAIVIRRDRKNADSMALHLGKQLRHRMLTTLGGK